VSFPQYDPESKVTMVKITPDFALAIASECYFSFLEKKYKTEYKKVSE